MTSLAWFLALVVVASAVCLFTGGWLASSRRSNVAREFKLLGSVYGVVVALTLAWMSLFFMGTQGNQHIPKSLQRRIAHSGYYFARDGEFRLVGDPSNVRAMAERRTSQVLTTEQELSEQNDAIRQLMPSDLLQPDGANAVVEGSTPAPSEAIGGDVLEQGFINRTLGRGESLTLRPNWNGEKATEWTLTYEINHRPLRLRSTEGETASRCINIPADQWLDDGDTIFLTREREGEVLFVSIEWTVGTKYWWPFTQKTNAYSFGTGAIRDGAPIYETTPTLMSERVLIDGLPLASLVRHARKDFRTQVGTIDQGWWSVFQDITLVREERGNKDSRIGLLIEDDLFRTPGVTIYKNLGDGNAQELSHNSDQSTTMRIPTSTIVACGFRGLQNSFELSLPAEVVQDEVWRQVMRITFVNPQVWRLPPEPNKDFIITSTNDYIPLDGYVLDIGNSPHSFYAKARVGDELDDLYVNDGRKVVNEEDGPDGEAGGPRRFRLDEPVSLGDYEQGILLKLVSSQSKERTNRLALIFGSLAETGRASVLLVALNALGFIFLLLRQKYFRPRLFLAWALIWGVTLTLLVVRLVLIYRVSLIPPLDASAGEVRGIFDKGVDYGLLGLAAFFVLTVSLVFVTRQTRRATWSRMRTSLMITLWGLLIVGYTVTGAQIGTNQSFGLRINIGDHLLLVIGFALLSKPTLESRSRILKGLMFLVIVAALVLQVVWVRDTGSIIYACSLAFVSALILGWDKSRGAFRNWIAAFTARRTIWLRKVLRRLSRIFPAPAARLFKSLGRWLLPVAVASSPLAILILSPLLVQPGTIRQVVQPALPDTVFYRFASFTDAEDAIVTMKSGEEDTDMSKLLENSRQNWQTLLYASQGAYAPVGYGQAPLSKTGMTYGTSVSDCAFSTYVLAEHGGTAAFFLLLLYVLLACVCVLSAWYFDDNARTRSVTLVAVGGYFAYNALYMAGANVGLFVFTGQNVPLLGLNSVGDLTQGLALVSLAGLLLLRSTQEGTVALSWQRRPVIIRWGTGLCIGAILLLAAVSFRISNIGKEDKYRHDHDLKPETVEKIVRDLPVEGSPATRQNEPLLLDGDRLERHQGARIMEIEEQYRKQLNDRTDKFNPNGGLYYLDRTRRLGVARTLRVKVNRRFFYARSPFTDPAVWRGEIVAGGGNDPTVYALNARLNISIQARGYPGSVELSNARSTRTTFSPLLREGTNQFCELTRIDDRLRLVPKRGDWEILVDGRRIVDPIDLAPLSIIVIDRRDPKYRRNLIYLGAIRPVLAYVRWRNGEQRRMFPEGSFTLAYFLGKAADQIQSAQVKLAPDERRLGPELALTLDVGLQQSLQRYLQNYAMSHANYSPFRENPNRLALTVLDGFSGQVLALPSWPLLDPSKLEYEKLVDRISEPTRSRFEDNANLRGHVVGSTVKPIVLATMATVLWPTRNLERLIVYNRADAHRSSEPTIHPHIRVGGINIELWDCNSALAESDMRNFIIHSLDYPEGVLGMLGMVDSPQELNRILHRDDRSPDLSYDGANYSLDLTRSSENGTAFSVQDQREGRLPFTRGKEAVNNTLLYRGLADVFDFACSDPQEVRLQRACQISFPTFYNPQISLSRNNYIDNVIPTRLDLGGGDFQGIRQGLLSCLLGGAPCEFNNVMMAEAAARLASGERIFARLEDSTASLPATLPNPLGNANWRGSNIIDPMELVGQVGTAHSFTDGHREARIRVPAQYRAIFKTGTMVEGNEDRESEALMFVVGRWDNGSFVRGETLAGFLYMEKSKVKNPPGQSLPDGDMKKFEFAAPIINKVIAYLASARRVQ